MAIIYSTVQIGESQSEKFKHSKRFYHWRLKVNRSALLVAHLQFLKQSNFFLHNGQNQIFGIMECQKSKKTESKINVAFRLCCRKRRKIKNNPIKTSYF
jgi:hypothetical protein